MEDIKKLQIKYDTLQKTMIELRKKKNNYILRNPNYEISDEIRLLDEQIEYCASEIQQTELELRGNNNDKVCVNK